MHSDANRFLLIGRSREGAWIEIVSKQTNDVENPVAPARERGLKFCFLMIKNKGTSRSREGAWIEIVDNITLFAAIITVAPARERGLKFFVALQP